jgi:predicted Zn-dependent protease
VLKNFDPPPWWYPVRRSTAAAYLKAGRYADAEREARTSLDDWPKDALALRVLSQAEARLGKREAARGHLAQARRAWEGDLATVPIDLT